MEEFMCDTVTCFTDHTSSQWKLLTVSSMVYPELNKHKINVSCGLFKCHFSQPAPNTTNKIPFSCIGKVVEVCVTQVFNVVLLYYYMLCCSVVSIII